MATPTTEAQHEGLLNDIHRQFAEERARANKAEDEVQQYKKLLEDQISAAEEEGEERRHNQDMKMQEALTAKESLEKWKANAEKEHWELQREFEKLKNWEQGARANTDEMMKTIEDGKKLNNNSVKERREAWREADNAQKALAAMTKERDNLKRERDSIARRAAALQEELRAVQAAQQTQSPFQASTSTAQPLPQASTVPQTTLEKSNSILNNIRGTASAAQTLPQRPELKYTQEDMNRCRVVAQQEQYELDKGDADQAMIQLNQRFEDLKQEAFAEINKRKGLAQAGATWANIDANEAVRLIKQLTNENEQLDKQSWKNFVDKGRLFTEKMAVEEKLKEKDTECTRVREQLSSYWYDLKKATDKSEEHRQGWVGEKKLSDEVVLNKNWEIRTLKIKVQDLEEEVKKRDDAKAVEVAQGPMQAVAQEADDDDIPGVVSLGIDAYPFLDRQQAVQAVSMPEPAPKPAPAENQKTKKRKRHHDDEEQQIIQQVPWGDPPADTLFKTAAVISAIGLVHVAKKRGWWF